MINETDFYTINVNDEVYETNFSNIYIASTVDCSPGKKSYQAVCGKTAYFQNNTFLLHWLQ